MPRDERARAPDPLSDVLSTLQLRGDVYARTEAAGAWGIAFPPGPARFHLVERGEVSVTVDGRQGVVHAQAGDLLVIPHGAAHTLGDRTLRRAVPLLELIKSRSSGSEFVFRVGRGAPHTFLLCGRFHLEPTGREALLAALPKLLHVQGRGGRPLEQVDLVLRLFSAEAHSDAPGSVIASARLVDLILVHAIRVWLSNLGEGVGGWLGAMRDAQIGAALAKLHAAPERHWTVKGLASAVGLSRSPFASRFTSLVGEPPLKYLTRWRMHLAANLLRAGRTVRDVAEAMGYESEAAFSRTFKRYMGMPPVKFRGARASRGR
jgi:AraC-like DNA-binding protein